MGKGNSCHRFAILYFCVILAIPHISIADDVGRGGYAGSFSRMGLGARSMAMGGGSVGLAGNSNAAYYNPGALVFLKGRHATATLNTMALDRRLTYIGYAQSLGDAVHAGEPGRIRAGFSIGWLSAGVSDIDGRNFNGEDIGTFSNNEHCFYFSFAIQPGPAIGVGFSAKLLYNRFPDLTDTGDAISSRGFGFDAGICFVPVPALSVGVAIHDLRSRYTWDTQNLWEKGTQTVNAFPVVIRGGAAWCGFSRRLRITADIEKVEYCPSAIMTGVEYTVLESISLRSGYYKSNITFGAGYAFRRANHQYVLDYAYVPDPVAPGPNHHFTWSFLF